MKPRFYVDKIYEPQPSTVYSWYIIDRDTKRIVAQYSSRSIARERCKSYNSAEYRQLSALEAK